jgi:hypothetical protein
LDAACFTHEEDQTGTDLTNAREPAAAKALREKKTMPAVLSALSVKIWDPHYAVRTKTKAGASRK